MLHLTFANRVLHLQIALRLQRKWLFSKRARKLTVEVLFALNTKVLIICRMIHDDTAQVDQLKHGKIFNFAMTRTRRKKVPDYFNQFVPEAPH